jgi:hypothetical protein
MVTSAHEIPFLKKNEKYEWNYSIFIKEDNIGYKKWN